MDIQISQYILESGICLLVFYGIYYFLLKKETFFQLNRAFLLFTALISICLPLFHINLVTPAKVEAKAISETEFVEKGIDEFLPPIVQQWHETTPEIWMPLEQVQSTPFLTFGQILWLLYAIGIVLMSFRFLQKFSKLRRIIRSAKKSRKDGYTLIKSRNLQASSFLGYVFWNEKEEDNELILAHELVHIRQNHSLDVLIMECLIILLWFNPFIYWYRNSLKELHEFIADQEVTKHNSTIEYASLLIQQHQKHQGSPFFNTFNSFIKKRLHMLQNQPSSNWRLMKYLIAMPILCALIILFAVNFSKKSPENVPESNAESLELENGLDQSTDPFNNQTISPFVVNSNPGSMEEEESMFQIKWGNKLCDCYPEKKETPNYFECENLSIKQNQFLKSPPFQLLKNGKEIATKEMWARADRTINLPGGKIQDIEIDEFNPSLPFFQALEPGDIVRFNFQSKGQSAGFFFKVLINNKRGSIKYGETIKVGSFDFSIDPMDGSGSYQLEYDEYRSLLNKSVRVVNRGGKTEEIISIRANVVHVGQRPPLGSRIRNKRRVRLKDLACLNDLLPGNNVNVIFQTKNIPELYLRLKILPDPKRSTPPATLFVDWGGLELSVLNPLMLEMLKELKDKNIQFFFDKKELNVSSIKKIEFKIGEKSVNVINKLKITRKSDWLNLIKEIADFLEQENSQVVLEEIGLEKNSYFTFLVLFRKRDNSVRKMTITGMNGDRIDVLTQKLGGGMKLTIQNPESYSLESLENSDFFLKSPPALILFGEEILNIEDRKKAFRDLQNRKDYRVIIYTAGAWPKGYEGTGKEVGLIEIVEK